MKERVVVTGMGAITPIGNNVEEFWSGVKAGKTGFDKISYFDATDYRASLAAQVKGFKATDYMDRKTAKRMELFCQYAVAASKEAIEDAGLAAKLQAKRDADTRKVLDKNAAIEAQFNA